MTTTTQAKQKVRSPDQPPDWMWLALSAWLLTNRVIPAHISVPGGFSIHPSELVLAAIIPAMCVSMAFGGFQFPKGVLGLTGLGVVAVLSALPFLNAGNLSASEIQTFDQGIILTYLYGGLVLLAFQCGRANEDARRVLAIMVVATTFQAIIAVVEGLTREAFLPVHTIWQSVGLEFDPRAAGGGVGIGVNTRLTGELRVFSTAPHPLVLSALMSVGAVLTSRLIFALRDTRLKWLSATALAFQVLAFAYSNSRTGMLVAAGCLPFLVASLIKRPMRLIALAVSSVALVALVAVGSPSTLRLALDTATLVQRDHNVEVRIDRIPLILDYLSERPFFGAGYLTHDATVRQLWDNAYLHGLSEWGLVGMAAFLGFLVTWSVKAYATTGRSELDLTLRLGAAAGLSGALLAALSLDAWTFDQFLPSMLVLIALAAGRGSRSKECIDTPNIRFPVIGHRG